MIKRPSGYYRHGKGEEAFPLPARGERDQGRGVRESQDTTTERMQQSGLLSPALSSRGGEGASPAVVVITGYAV